MKKMAIALLSVLGASSVFADQRTYGIRDVTTIADRNGATRILFKAAPVNVSEIVILRATLQFGTGGTVTDRRMRLQLHPVTTEWRPGAVGWTAGWSRAGGDFDDDLYAWSELDLNRSGAELVFDMTRVVKEIVEEGAFADGFVVTVDPTDGIGLRAEDVRRFQNLASASLELKYRNIHPRRRDANRSATQTQRDAEVIAGDR
jgi:hypothetical protein